MNHGHGMFRPRRIAWFGIGASVALTWLSPLAHGATPFADSACLTQDAASSAKTCEALARQVSHDITAIRALGRALEQRGRYRDATAAYQIALAVHPNHRDLLQRMIRARAQSRSANLVLSQQGDGQPPIPLGPSPVAANKQQATAVVAANLPPLSTQQAAAGTSPPKTNTPNKSSGEIDFGPAAAGRYLALVIGNEKYQDFTPLRSPIADAHAIGALLARDYGFNVSVLTNATRYQIVSALSRLRQQAAENDSVLIYYAGHGYLDETTSRGYWLPVDAERDNVANWLSTSDITDVLAGLQARHALILADSCFSGTLLRGDPAVMIDERDALIRKLSARRSRTIMTSGGLEPVVDSGAGSHSVFAQALLRSLRENRQPLEAGRLFVQIRDRVAADTEQTPQYAPLRSAGHDGGDFIFSRSAPPR